ncbi:MAG: UDP-N-acetylmuramoyl-L-alanyl-D-glutamate--2,6-diaminopimelate ligase [Acidimicrobiales bacterium]
MADRRVALGALWSALGPTVSAQGGLDTEIRGIAYDSRRVQPGDLFCCLVGEQEDGHRFAPQAVEAGAAALLVERRLALPVPQLVAADARAAMALASVELYGSPASALTVVGVTGTNGKTTVTHLLAQILEAAGLPTAVIGTLSGPRTTPEAPDLQARLAELVGRGVEAVAMEVSSHALALHRVDGIRFAAAVFTNLSRDHLDFHATMEAYFAAKARLFTPEFAACGVVNLDDAHGSLLHRAATIPSVGYSLSHVSELHTERLGARFTWTPPRPPGAPPVRLELRLRLTGRFNVANTLAAAACALELGVAPEAIAQGLAQATPPPGRFEPIDAGQPYAVLVDYAHTPDALEQALESARGLAEPAGRVLVVFGCGGDRDRTKRAPMGEVAARLADAVFVTSDNPRHEDPAAILDDIRAGFARRDHVTEELDRRAAIAAAFDAAGPGDVVLIAGKGHERTQTIGGVVHEFDDRVVAREELRRR